MLSPSSRQWRLTVTLRREAFFAEKAGDRRAMEAEIWNMAIVGVRQMLTENWRAVASHKAQGRRAGASVF